MLLLGPAARPACYASREGSVELFELARCHLGSRAAIVSARQRLLPALWFVGVRVRTQSSRIGAAPSPRLVGSGCRVLVCKLASCKTLATLGAHQMSSKRCYVIEGVLFLKGKDTVVTSSRRANENEQCCGTPAAAAPGRCNRSALSDADASKTWHHPNKSARRRTSTPSRASPPAPAPRLCYIRSTS